MTGRSQRCWPIRQVRRVSSATHSFEHFFGGVQLKWALFWANDWNLTLLSNPLFFEHFFELITHKSTFLSALLINETFLNTFLRTQKSGFALKSAFLSGFTLLRAFLSAQKSAQGPAEPLWNILHPKRFICDTELICRQNNVNRSKALCKMIQYGKIHIYCVKSPIQCKITCCVQNCTLNVWLHHENHTLSCTF